MPSYPGHYDEYPELTRECSGDSLKQPLIESPKPITDTERVDFHLERRTAWYPDHREKGVGILCYDAKPGVGSRIEVTGKTWRDAVDAAIRRETRWEARHA